MTTIPPKRCDGCHSKDHDGLTQAADVPVQSDPTRCAWLCDDCYAKLASDFDAERTTEALDEAEVTIDRLVELGAAALPTISDEWGSDRQIAAENAYGAAVERFLADSAELEPWRSYCLKATTEEIVGAGLDAARRLCGISDGEAAEWPTMDAEKLRAVGALPREAGDKTPERVAAEARTARREIDFSFAVWPFQHATPQGFTDRPFHIAEVTYEYPGYTLLRFYSREGVRDNPIIGINGDGIYVYDDDEALDRGDSSSERGASCAHETPVDGWKVKSVRCDQTGGMCMVDVFEFENGYVVSLNDEAVLMFRTMADYDALGDSHDSPDDVGGCAVWLV